MVAERIEGALATLVRVGAAGAAQFHARLRHDDGLCRSLGLRGPPELADVASDLAEDDLFVWEIHPDGGKEVVGFAGLVFYSGPPFVFVHLTSTRRDLDVAQDAMLQLVHGYFQTTDFPELWTYQEQPLDEEIHAMLVEGGFDYWDDDLPGVDLTKEAAYSMERHTYDAYYGEAADEERELEL